MCPVELNKRSHGTNVVGVQVQSTTVQIVLVIPALPYCSASNVTLKGNTSYFLLYIFQ